MTEIKVEFTDEVKESLLDDITTMKKMLDNLAKEINGIGKGAALEFITPVLIAGRIEDNIRIVNYSRLKSQAWISIKYPYGWLTNIPEIPRYT